MAKQVTPRSPRPAKTARKTAARGKSGNGARGEPFKLTYATMFNPP